MAARDPPLAVGIALSNVQRCVELIRKAKLDRLIVRSLTQPYPASPLTLVCYVIIQEGDNFGHRVFKSLLQQMITPDRHKRLLNARRLLETMQDRECMESLSPL